jgi:hypothetical protein
LKLCLFVLFQRADDKLRLMLLYVLTLDGLSESEKRSILEQTGLHSSDIDAIEGLRSFGVVLGAKRDLRLPDSPFSRQARKLAVEDIRGEKKNKGYSDILQSLGLGYFASTTKSNEDHLNYSGDFLLEEYLPKTDYASFDRFQPAVSYIIIDHILGRLSNSPGTPFPYVEDPSRRNRELGIESAVRKVKDSFRVGIYHQLFV